EAAGFLKQAQRRHPGDFWINHDLGLVLLVELRRPQDALSYLRAALALRPDSAGPHHNLAGALRALGDLPGAAASYQRALALDPKTAWTHYRLGNALYEQGDLAAAAAAFRKATDLKPAFAHAHHDLAVTLQAQGDLKGAIAS